MKIIMCFLVFVALTLSMPSATAQGPTVTSVEAQFDTTKDNKNGNSKLDLYLKNVSGQEVGKSEGNEGIWDKHSTHTVALQIKGNPTKADVEKGSILLTFHPQGADTWKFNYKVTLSFSDGSSITKELFGGILTEYKTSRADPL